MLNSLVNKLRNAEKERNLLVTRLHAEEEHIQNNLKKRLRKVAAEKVKLQNQLDRETEYIANKALKQLQKVISEKNKLKAKYKEEHYAAKRLVVKIIEEEAKLKKGIQERVEMLQREKLSIEFAGQAEIESMVNKMAKSLAKLTSDKK